MVLSIVVHIVSYFTGSHVVGSIPLQALVKAADHYIEKENVFLIKEQQKIRFIIDRLGLNSVSEFKPESKVRFDHFHVLLFLVSTGNQSVILNPQSVAPAEPTLLSLPLHIPIT